MKIPTPSWFLLGLLSLFAAALARAASPEITEAMVQARLDKGQELAAGGFEAQALKELLWCYDEGMVAVPKFKFMRTSVLVGMIKRLANNYGPAEEAMSKRCADSEKRLLAGDENAATEFTAWCDALNDERRLVKIFDKLPPDDARRRGFGMVGFNALFGKRRYADAVSALPFDAMTRIADVQISRGSKSSGDEDRGHDNAVNQLLDFIEALAGAKDAAHADQMVAKLKAFDSSGGTKRDIEKRLKRAG